VAKVTKVAKVTGEIKKARQSLFNDSKLKTHNSKLSVRKDGTNEIDEMDETNDEDSCS
jgi:vacuolar-type H+-ATPase subunit H